MELREGVDITKKKLEGMKAWGRTGQSDCGMENIPEWEESCARRRQRCRYGPEAGPARHREKRKSRPRVSAEGPQSLPVLRIFQIICLEKRLELESPVV